MLERTDSDRHLVGHLVRDRVVRFTCRDCNTRWAHRNELDTNDGWTVIDPT